MIPMLAVSPEWHYMVMFTLFGALVGGWIVHLIYGYFHAKDQHYIEGLKEDRECRDKYLEKLLGRWPDLPYCEDDDL